MPAIIAMFKHESNSFSPIRADRERFGQWSDHMGHDAVSAYRGTAMPLAAYIDALDRAGVPYLCPIAFEAMPSGPVERTVFDECRRALLAAITPDTKIVLLDLHGAMIVEGLDEPEAALVEEIRRTVPGAAIGVTCDLHGNISSRMVENCDVLVGYKTYPHLDMYECGSRVAAIVLKVASGGLRVSQAIERPGIIAHTLKMGSDDEPMRALQERTREMEKRPGVLTASVFGGFPLSDVPHAGMSAVVATDPELSMPQELASELKDAMLSVRADFIYNGSDLQATLDAASADTEFPILLLDHCDNCGSGGTQDVMHVLSLVIDSGLEDVIAAPIYDPFAAARFHLLGEGSSFVRAPLGGLTRIDSMDIGPEPLFVSGSVVALSDGTFTIEGDMYRGVRVNVGPTALIDIGSALVVVVSRHHEPWDTGIFKSLGVDPTRHRYILLKCRMHHRAAYEKFVRRTYLCDGIGATTSDLKVLRYRNVPRNNYPFSEFPENAWAYLPPD